MLVYLRDGSAQFYVLPHWDRSCRSNFLSHPVTVYWHQADQSQRWPYNARRLAGYPLECQFLSHWYDSTPKKSRRKRDSNPESSALEEDTLPLRQRGGPPHRQSVLTLGLQDLSLTLSPQARETQEYRFWSHWNYSTRVSRGWSLESPADVSTEIRFSTALPYCCNSVLLQALISAPLRIKAVRSQSLWLMTWGPLLTHKTVMLSAYSRSGSNWNSQQQCGVTHHANTLRQSADYFTDKNLLIKNHLKVLQYCEKHKTNIYIYHFMSIFSV